MSRKIVPRCCICNEKLINGYCYSCGYDNRRNDIYRQNQSQYFFSASQTVPNRQRLNTNVKNARRRPQRHETSVLGLFLKKAFSVLLLLFCLLFIYCFLTISLPSEYKLQHPEIVLSYMLYICRNVFYEFMKAMGF